MRVEFKSGEIEITPRGNKRPVNCERVELKPGEIEIAPRGNKRPVNSEKVEFKPGETEISLVPQTKVEIASRGDQ